MPPKFGENIFQTMICRLTIAHFGGKNYVKFGNFINFSGKNHVKFGHSVNFSYIFFRQKCLAP